MTVEVRALRSSDDRSAFRSGDEALDLYFHRYAGQNRFRHHIGRTYVALEHDRILGFATVSPASVEAESLPGEASRPPFPVPVLRIARLAVDERDAGRGIGSLLMRHCIELAEHLRDVVGCVGLIVDAKPGALAFYARLGFEAIVAIEGASPQRPPTTAMFLALGSVPPRR